MADKINDLREELEDLKYRNGLLQKIDCSIEDTKKYQQMIKNGEPLPDGVFQYKDQTGTPVDSFYTIYQADLDEKEKLEYFILKQSLHIQTIKNYVLFFTVLAVISLLFWVLLLLN